LTNYKATFNLNAGTFNTKQALEEQFLIYHNRYSHCIFNFIFNSSNSNFISSTNYVATMYKIIASSRRSTFVLNGGATRGIFYYVKLEDGAFYYNKFLGTEIN
jgi:hypothetical protein